jgi:4-amino-4-deoxy-L-arabinose transferase
MLLLLYRITLILTGNKITSTIAALLLCFSNYQLQLISGIEGMDHNDLAFDFYMLASCWAYAEYSINKKWYWIVLIGIFSGCAILNKWLVGLAVFLGWGVNILFKFYKTKSITEIGWMLLSLVVCAAVFIPWQWYCYSNWPHEFITEMKFNTRHITEVLEGHDGPMSYYYDARDLFVGKYLVYLVPVGILFFIRDKKNNVEVLISICSIFLFVFIFYSFVVLTKVHSHFFFVIPFVLIFIANAVSKIFFQSKISITKIAIIIVMIYLSINPNYFINYLSKENKHRESCIQNAILYRNMDKLIPANCKIVMNTHQLENINIMFYHPEIRANDSCIGNADLSICATKKEWIAVFPDHNDFKLSTQILKYPYLFKIKTELK